MLNQFWLKVGTWHMTVLLEYGTPKRRTLIYWIVVTFIKQQNKQQHKPTSGIKTDH